MVTTDSHSLFADLEARRVELGMPLEALVQRSGVSRATVRRVLKGDHAAVSLANLLAVTAALGVELRHAATADADTYREQQAERKARRLVGLVQGTMGLEAQAVPGPAVERMVKQTVRALLTGPARKLWAE